MASSETLRTQGNALYRAGKLESDAAPPTNLSAAYYELGDYQSAVTACNQALELQADEKKRQTLLIRKARSQIYLLQLDDAESTYPSLSDSTERKALFRTIAQLKASRGGPICVKSIHARIISELPRIKPQIRTAQEYFVFGHDVPASLFTPKLAKSGRNKISLMFGGIGDGRHLLATLINARAQEGMGKIPATKHFHLTIVDHKPAVIARNLIILILLGGLADMASGVNVVGVEKLIPCLFYVFLAPIMPHGLHAVLQKTIKTAIDVLEQRKPMPLFLDISPKFRPSVLTVLKEWQHEVGVEFPASELRPSIASNRQFADWNDAATAMKYTGLQKPDTCTLAGCEKQEAFHHRTAILVLTQDGRGHGPELQSAFEKFRRDDASTIDRQTISHVESTWKTNPTMIDLSWERGRTREARDQNLCHDPFQFGQGLVMAGLAFEQDEGGLFEYLRIYFWSAAEAISHFSKDQRLKIEACVGDVTAVLEQIRYGTVGHHSQSLDTPDLRSQGSEVVAPMPSAVEQGTDGYPHVYDCIHLSNIPDYVGGSLATFVYAVPQIYPGKACYVTSNCLRNPPRFKTHAHYYNEYNGLCTPGDLKATFQVRPFLEQYILDEPGPIVLTEYVKFFHEPEALTSSTRMPRHRVEIWLYRIFLKLAIPKDRIARDQVLVYSPLNLTAFIRLCGHLLNIGYPMHWISGVLDEICSGRINTAARPPRSQPLTIEETNSSMPSMQQSTRPFTAEMTTLVSLWQTVLPGGVINKYTTTLDVIHKYQITFEDVDDSIPEPAHFVLLLFNTQYLPPGLENLRPYILSDELGDNSQRGALVRENVQFMTTWNWNFEMKTAEFWLRSDIMEELQNMRRWAIQIWRIDQWTYQSMPKLPTDCKDLGRFVS